MRTLPDAVAARFARLTYQQQFGLISLIFTLPLLLVLGFYLDLQYDRVRFASKEIEGTVYLREVADLFEQVLAYRRANELRQLGDPGAAGSMPALRAKIDAELKEIAAIDERLGAGLRSTPRLAEVQARWAAIEGGDDSAAAQTELIAAIRRLIAVVGDYSNLILDPDLDTYYVMDAVLLRLPEGQDTLASSLLLAEAVASRGGPSAAERNELIRLAGLIRSNLTTLKANLLTSYNNNPDGSLRPALSPRVADLETATIGYVELVEAFADENAAPPASRLISVAGEAALDRSFALYRAASPALERRINDRIARFMVEASLNLVLGLVLTSLAFVVGLRVMRSISRPLNGLSAASSRLAAGELSARVAVRGDGSQIDRVSRAFNAMADQIEAARDQLEQRVIERTRELEAKTREAEEHRRIAEDARAVAEEATRAKSAFLANMSHELRTPLNAIIGYSEMLQDEAEDLGYDSFTPDLEKIRTAGRHLLALINDILDLSKIEAGRMELFVESFSLPDLVAEVSTTVAPLFEKNGNRLTVSLEPSLTSMHADLTKTRQSLLNLLSNATKFTEGGLVSLTITGERIDGVDFVRMAVSDTGIGMRPDQVARLFREFSQADNSTTRKYGGTGLGLALSRRFCQMMGGDITVTSEVGRGSTFTIHLPRAVAGPDQAPEPLQATARMAAAVRPGGTVLVIDDDLATRDLLSHALSREGIRVILAATGEDGLMKAREHRPDVITLDVLLGGMDGWTVLNVLKADPGLAGIPVIMLTIMDDRSTGFALGAADYLTKPVDRQRLLDLVHRHVPVKTTAPVLVVEDDPPTREILCRTIEQQGFPVITAENGRVALERLGAERPALILLDLMMPEMDGFGFLERVQQRPEWLSIPVIVVTAMDLTSEDRERLSHSVRQVLQKGAYEREALLREVRALVGQSLTSDGAATVETR